MRDRPIKQNREDDRHFGGHQVIKRRNLQNAIIGKIRLTNSAEAKVPKKCYLHITALRVCLRHLKNPRVALFFARYGMFYKRKRRCDSFPIKWVSEKNRNQLNRGVLIAMR